MDSNIQNGPPVLYDLPQTSFGLKIYESLKKNKTLTYPAIRDVVNNVEISYHDLLVSSCKLAIWLKNEGCMQNDVISVCSENNVNFFKPVIAALYSGIVVASVNHSYTEGELLHALEVVKPKVVFCSETTYKLFWKLLQTENKLPYVKRIAILDTIDSITKHIKCDVDKFQPLEVNANEQIGVVMYSSGTTGLAKGVMLTHTNMFAAHRLSADPRYFPSTMENSVLFVPFYHIMGFFFTLNFILNGLMLKFLPKFEEKLFLSSIEKYKTPIIAAVPPIMVLFAKSPLVDKYDLSSLKSLPCGAAPLSKEVENAVKNRLNVEITQFYGLTEATFGTLVFENNLPKKSGSTGKPVPGVSIKIRDPITNKSLEANETGEICIKGDTVMKGYFNNAEATNQSFSEDGWLLTGDLGYYDEDGYFFIVDRLKELIKYKGFQVAPAELEALLLTHPKIGDAGVVGLSDEVAGELPMAFVVKKTGVELCEAEVIEFVAKRISLPKRLHGGVIFIDSIPKNPSGKILRKDLRKYILESKL